MNFTIFCPFGGIFAAFAAQFLKFLQFCSGAQKYVWKDVIHTVIKKKIIIIILRDFL